MSEGDIRKNDHISLTGYSQINPDEVDTRFCYEPMLSSHKDMESAYRPFQFLGKQMHYPVWISSMTGGNGETQEINYNLARVAGKYGLGMGLGSVRKLLEDDSAFDSFNLRPILGDNTPLMANIGICQVAELVKKDAISAMEDVLNSLKADALMVHVNPLQEFFQSEGDRLSEAPINVIKKLLGKANFPVGVKEVGQGFGPLSLMELVALPLQVLEFGAFGGTNFTKLELLRHNNNKYLSNMTPVAMVGHTASDMVNQLAQLFSEQSREILPREFIISGGIRSWIDGYYLVTKLDGILGEYESCKEKKCVFGQAGAFLAHACESFESLDEYVEQMICGLKLAKTYLTVRE